MENQNQNINQTPPVSPVIATPPISNQINPPTGGSKPKLPLAVIIGTIVFLLVAGSAAGFYVFKQQSSKIAVKPTPTPSQTITPSPTPDPTASWRTYTNTQLGFSFKYPQTFEIKPSNSTEPNSFDITINSPAEYSNPDQIHISLTVTKNINNVSFADYLKEGYGQPTHPGGNPSFTVEGILKDFKATNIPLPNSFSYKGNMVKGDLPRTLFSYKNDFYTFVLYGGAGEGAGYSPEAEKIYDQILSTFKFTASNLTPTPTCMQRPACLDATPRCLIAEPANGWCPYNQACNSDADCPSDSSCIASGPLVAGQTPKKTCVKKGTAVPL